MKINNRFLSRLFAGFVVATVIATSTPVSAFAEEISPSSEVVEVQDGESVEAENTDMSEGKEETDTEAVETDTEEIANTEETENTEETSINIEDTARPEVQKETDDPAGSMEAEEEDQMDTFFEEMTEAAQKALPATTVLSQQTPYGPARIQWRSSATNPYIPNTSAGTIRFVTQNPSSPFYSYSYWGGYSSQYECGITCQSMALSYLGVQHQPGDLLAYGGGVSRIGTSYWTNIVGGYDHQGYPGCNGTALKQAINNYLANKQTNPKYSPVFIHLNNYPTAGYSAYGGSHYVLIIGVVDEAANIYQTLDPWDNTVSRVTLTFGTYPTATYKAFTTQIYSDSIDEFYQFTRPSGNTGTIKPVVPDTTPVQPSQPSDNGEKITKVDNKAAVVLCNEVNVRRDPSTLNAAIATVNKYDKLTVIGQSTNWYKVKYNNNTKTGYVHKDFVGIGKRPATVTFTLKKYYNNRIKISWKKLKGASGYKVQRYNPSTGKYKTIKKLVGDSKTSYMDTGLKNGKSYTYRVYAYTIWKGKYTLRSLYPKAQSKKASSYMMGKTTGSMLNVRKGPGTNYGILKTLNKSGVEIRVYSLSKSWYKVKLKMNGSWKKGYIIKDFVKL